MINESPFSTDKDAFLKESDIKSISSSTKQIKIKTFPLSKTKSSKKSHPKESKQSTKNKKAEGVSKLKSKSTGVGGELLISNFFKPVPGKTLDADKTIQFNFIHPD